MLTEADYRNLRNVSYSLLSSLDKRQLPYVREYLIGNDISEYRKPSTDQDIGSYIDAVMFHDEQYLEDNFYILATNYSEGLYTTFIKSIVDFCFNERALQIPMAAYLEMKELGVLMDRIMANYGAVIDNMRIAAGFKLPIGTVIKKVVKDYHDYFIEMCLSHNKTAISLDNGALVSHMENALRTTMYTQQIFRRPDLNHTGPIPIEYQYQVPFLFDYISVDRDNNPLVTRIKVLWDILMIDHVNKRVTVKDLKSQAGSAYDFRYNFLRWRYYLQSSLYIMALQTWLNKKQEAGFLSGYTVDPQFEFIVVGKKPVDVCKYKCSETDITLGISGFTSRNGVSVKGVDGLLADLEWHRRNGLWDYPIEVAMNGGFLELNVLQNA